MSRTVKIGGIYRHFKGNIYQVIAVAKDCSDLHDVVVYKNEDGSKVWVRDLDEFLSDVTRDGKTTERFTLLNQGE